MKGESRVEAIVYTTNTGSAAQYAEMLAKETGLAAYSLDEARGKVPADSEVIYLGWVMAGTVKGYAAAAKRYIVRAVCAVGMAQPGAQGKILRERNKLPESVPLFQLQGNFELVVGCGGELRFLFDHRIFCPHNAERIVQDYFKLLSNCL